MMSIRKIKWKQNDTCKKQKKKTAPRQNNNHEYVQLNWHKVKSDARRHTRTRSREVSKQMDESKRNSVQGKACVQALSEHLLKFDVISSVNIT